MLAVDNGVPPGTGMATVTVTVTNANDNAPMITNPPGMSLQLPEFPYPVPVFDMTVATSSCLCN